MKKRRFWLWISTLVLWTGLSLEAANRTQARLLLDASSARPGDTVTAALELKMDPGWHTYWKNAGDSGGPTKIDWLLPKGIQAGETQWPAPEKYEVEGLVTYVFHGTVHLLVPLRLAVSGLEPGVHRIAAKVSWLECEKLCVQGKADVEARLVVGAGRVDSEFAGLIAQVKDRLPKSGPTPPATVQWIGPARGEERTLAIRWLGPATRGSLDFFPYRHDSFEVAGATESARTSADTLEIRKTVLKLEGDWPSVIEGVLALKTEAGQSARFYEAKLTLDRPPTEGSATTMSASAPPPPVRGSLPVMLVFAFLGGLILNFMPCVLPVIALKVLGFVNQTKEEPARVRHLGIVYGLGVLTSFLVLAGLAIAVQSAGGTASWGMAFRNPIFRVAMTVLVTLVALNLFGVFEVVLSGRAMGAASDLASREGNAGAFFNGVLATLLATPCTAPFLSVALGFAFTQPAAVVVLMFSAVGLGLAAPFVALCWQPGWLRILPRPGVWMEHFKVAMGFPMMATAVWLFWSTAPRYGKSGVLWLGLFLVTLAAATWVWGQFVQKGRKRRGLALAASVALLLTGYAYCLEIQLEWRRPGSTSSPSTALTEVPGGIPWQRWSSEAVAKARAEKRPVLVDFTADTCLNCQVNKKTSLEIEATRKKLREIDAVALLGDYTDEDPAIAAELKRFGRPGVPLVLVYPKDASRPPLVLPEILTPGIVMDALEKAVN